MTNYNNCQFVFFNIRKTTFIFHKKYRDRTLLQNNKLASWLKTEQNKKQICPWCETRNHIFSYLIFLVKKMLFHRNFNVSWFFLFVIGIDGRNKFWENNKIFFCDVGNIFFKNGSFFRSHSPAICFHLFCCLRLKIQKKFFSFTFFSREIIICYNRHHMVL